MDFPIFYLLDGLFLKKCAEGEAKTSPTVTQVRQKTIRKE